MKSTSFTKQTVQAPLLYRKQPSQNMCQTERRDQNKNFNIPCWFYIKFTSWDSWVMIDRTGCTKHGPLSNWSHSYLWPPWSSSWEEMSADFLCPTSKEAVLSTVTRDTWHVFCSLPVTSLILSLRENEHRLLVPNFKSSSAKHRQCRTLDGIQCSQSD